MQRVSFCYVNVRIIDTIWKLISVKEINQEVCLKGSVKDLNGQITIFQVYSVVELAIIVASRVSTRGRNSILHFFFFFFRPTTENKN